MTDQELLHQYVQQGSKEAICELMRRHAGMVHATATREAGDSHLADDITQAVFLVLLRRARHAKAEAGLGGWLFKTTIFVAAEARRATTRRQHHEQEGLPMHAAPPPDSEALAAEVRGLLNAAVNRLPPSDREIVVQRYLEGRTPAQVAAELGITENNVRLRQSRAVEKLRKLFGKRGALLAAAALIGLLETLDARSAPANCMMQIEAVLRGAVPTNAVGGLAEGAINMIRAMKMKRTWLLGAAAAAALLLLASPLALSQNAPARPAPVPAAAPVAPGPNTPPQAVGSTTMPARGATANARGQSTPPPAVAPGNASVDPATRELAAANSAFALRFLQQVSPDTTQNAFYSPYSISEALAMTWVGARGQTAAQMTRALQLDGLNAAEITPAFLSLRQALAKTQQDTGAQLNIANSLWPELNPEHALLPDFLNQVKRDFGTTLTPLDFKRNSGTSEKTINTWVSDKTNGKIKDILRNNVTPDTRLVLVNAVYFKGQWNAPFPPRRTVEADFHLAGGKTQPVTLMHNTFTSAEVQYANFPNAKVPYQALSLGYNQGMNFASRGILSLVVFLPRETDALAALEKELTVDAIDASMKPMTYSPVEVFLPKFHIEQRIDLKDSLKLAGMTDAFHTPGMPDGADLSGMNGARDLFISFVVQQSYIDLDEKGTEAAAATAVGASGTGAPGTPQAKPPVFRADHPFLFMIRENRTGTILFLGRLAVPANPPAGGTPLAQDQPGRNNQGRGRNNRGPAPTVTLPPGEQSLGTKLAAARANLDHARSELAVATTNNHGGYVEKARTDAQRALADLDAAADDAKKHPEMDALPAALSPESAAAAARVKARHLAVDNNQSHLVNAHSALQAALAILDETAGGNLGGSRDKLIADIDAAATNITQGFDFLHSGKNTQPAAPTPNNVP